jgi:hypothetical protein
MAAGLCDLLIQLRLAEPAQGAIRVVDDHDLASVHDRLRYRQRSNSVSRGAASGVADHVGVSRSEPKQGVDVNASVHACEDRQMLHGFDDASCAPEVVKPRVHEDPVDGVHQLANLHRSPPDGASPIVFNQQVQVTL